VNILKELPNFYCVTPAFILFSRKLSSFDKNLYSAISSLTNLKGYCYATNSFFEFAFNCADRTIQRSISNLSNQGFISVDIIKSDETNQVIERQIRLVYPSDKNVVTPSDKNVGVTRDNAFNLKNTLSSNTSVITPNNFFSKSKKPDIQIEWLDAYYNSLT